MFPSFCYTVYSVVILLMTPFLLERECMRFQAMYFFSAWPSLPYSSIFFRFLSFEGQDFGICASIADLSSVERYFQISSTVLPCNAVTQFIPIR